MSSKALGERFLVFEIGGTQLHSADVGRGDFRVHSPRSRSTPSDMCELREIVQEECARLETIVALVFIIAGKIRKDRRGAEISPNVIWIQGDLASEFESIAPVVVFGDMESALRGERSEGGALRGVEWGLFDTISSGWGGSLVLGDIEVVGEPGHVEDPSIQGMVCGCGNPGGCVEAKYSGNALVRRILDHLRRSCVIYPEEVDPWVYFSKELDAEAPWATEMLHEWAVAVGRVWGNVLNRISRISTLAYQGTTAIHLVPRVREIILKTLYRVSMFHDAEQNPVELLEARVEHRSLIGAASLANDYLGKS